MRNALLRSEREDSQFDRRNQVHEQSSVPTACRIHPGKTGYWTEPSTDCRSGEHAQLPGRCDLRVCLVWVVLFREMALLPNTRTHAFVAERTDYEPVANRGFDGLLGN